MTPPRDLPPHPIPAAPPVLSYAAPRPPSAASPVLNYESQSSRRPARDAAFLLFAAVVLALIGLAVLGGTIDLLIVTWPSFGSTLFAVPAGVVAAAFFIVATTAARAALWPTSAVATGDESTITDQGFIRRT